MDGKPKEKGEKQPRRTLKKLENRMKSWLKTTTPEDKPREQPNLGVQERPESQKPRIGEVGLPS